MRGGTRFVLRLPCSPAEWQSSLERREDAATARDTDHRQRTATADARDITLSQRETTADQRDATLVEREAVAEGRDTEASASLDRKSGSDPVARFTSTEQHWSVANPATYTWETLAGPLSMAAMMLRSLRSRQTTNSSETDDLDALIVEIDRAFSMVMRTNATGIHDAAAPDQPPSSTRPNTGQ